MDGVRIRISRKTLGLANEPIARALHTITGMLLLQVGIFVLAMRGVNIKLDTPTILVVSVTFALSTLYVWFRVLGIRPMTFVLGILAMALMYKLAIATDGRLPLLVWVSLGFMLIAFQWPFRNGGLRFASLTLAVTLLAHSFMFVVPRGWTARVEVEAGLWQYVTEPGLHFRSFRGKVQCVEGSPTYELEPVDTSVFDVDEPDGERDLIESDTIEI